MMYHVQIYNDLKHLISAPTRKAWLSIKHFIGMPIRTLEKRNLNLRQVTLIVNQLDLTVDKESFEK